MKRMARQPTRLGVFDLIADIGHELNVPLNRISEAFSFDDAAKLSIEDERMLIGRRAEKMFEYVVASLGKAEFVQQEDAAAPLYAGADVQAPDYFVLLKSGERYLVEVKHARKETFNQPVSFSKNYLARLKRYADLKGYPLTIAVYWQSLNIWTVNKVEDFESPSGTINLRFVDALQRSIFGDFGDRSVAIVPPLICHIHASPSTESSVNEDNEASFVIGGLSFYSEGKKILSELEQQAAFYLLFHADWEKEYPTAKMDGQRVDYFEIVVQPPERNEGQEFEFIGSTAGMISKHFAWLTTADERIVRLTPQLTPAQMTPVFDEFYKGEVLRMWQFYIQPNYKPLVRKNG